MKALIVLLATFTVACASTGRQELLAFGVHPRQRDVSQTAVVAAATLLLSTAAPAWAAGDVGRGEALFVGNCAGCHAGGQNFVSPDRNLHKEALEKFGIGVEQPGIQSFFSNSGQHKKLVFFKVEGGKLNPQQLEDVTTYIADQAAGDKWEG